MSDITDEMTKPTLPGKPQVPGETTGNVDLSAVLPFCNEEENLPELLARLRTTLEAEQLSYELIFVDDGSTDAGVAFLEEAARSDPRIKVLVLSRNFGQHIAATAGIDAACGQMVLWMDTDLQERPEDIPRLVAKFQEGFDVVYSRHTRRPGTRWRAVLSHVSLAMLNRFVGFPMAPDRGAMRLFSAQVAQALRRLKERNRYMGYLMPWAGYRSAEIEIGVDPRRHGKTKYSLLGLVRHALTGLTAFSVTPLRLAVVFSVATILLCAGGVTFVLYRYFVHGFAVTGWASLIIAMLVLHSLQFAVLAVIGEYLGLTYTETKHRPLYFCARAINFATPAEPIRSMPKTDAIGTQSPLPELTQEVSQEPALS